MTTAVNLSSFSAPSGEPVMRVSQLRSNLVSLADLGPGRERDVRELLGPDLLRAVETAPRNAWLPVQVDVDLAEAVGGICGEDGVRRWSCRALRRSIEGPLLGPIVRGAPSVFGPNPARLFALVPRSISQIYRDCGTWDADDRGPDYIRLCWHGVPDAVVHSQMSIAAFAGAFEAVLEVAQIRGTVHYAIVDDSPVNTIEFMCRWSA